MLKHEHRKEYHSFQFRPCLWKPYLIAAYCGVKIKIYDLFGMYTSVRISFLEVTSWILIGSYADNKYFFMIFLFSSPTFVYTKPYCNGVLIYSHWTHLTVISYIECTVIYCTTLIYCIAYNMICWNKNIFGRCVDPSGFLVWLFKFWSVSISKINIIQQRFDSYIRQYKNLLLYNIVVFTFNSHLIVMSCIINNN